MGRKTWYGFATCCCTVMWITRRRHVCGCGMTQMRRASSKQTTTAICLLETVLRTLEGKYLGHRDGAGDVQNDEDEENELAEDDREGSLEGKENLEIKVMEGVASSFGDLSTNGSLPGVLKSFHAVRSRNPISAGWHRV